ncbi:MAG: PEGA domain-containing protein, partial [Verrucomicrobia bacterium]|nr:PEGA domain-containing protein [Verrucomicrobiota bacterium]
MSEAREQDPGRTVLVLRPGAEVFGRYTLLALVGEGGMGVVWRGRDEKLEREVALKFLPDHVRRDPKAIRELKRETNNCLALTHTNIVRVHTFEEDVLAAAIVMEYVPGRSLLALQAERPTACFEVAELAPLVRQLCAALDYAHFQARVVHRDLKPGNLLVTAAGQLKVVDFGIARSLQDSRSRQTADLRGTSGTLGYMSPQQLDGGKDVPAHDIYGLGATLYDLLTGHPPFYKGDIMGQIRVLTPAPLAERRAELGNGGAPIPQEWERTVLACLAKKAEERPPSAGTVLAMLDGRISDRTIEVSPLRGDKSAGAAPAEGTGAKTDRDRTIKVEGAVPARSAGIQPALEEQSTEAERGLPPSPELWRTGKLRATEERPADRKSAIENRKSKIPLVAGLAAGLMLVAAGGWYVARLPSLRDGNEAGLRPAEGKGSSAVPKSPAATPDAKGSAGIQPALSEQSKEAERGLKLRATTSASAPAQPAPQAASPALPKEFVVTVDPPDAGAHLWLGPQSDLAVAAGGRALVKDLPDGEHELIVQAPGFQAFTTRVTVKDGRGSAEAKLVAVKGSFELAARPGTVVTAIDARGRETRVGSVPAGGVLNSDNLLVLGVYSFRFTHPDCVEAKQEKVELLLGRAVKLAPAQTALAGELRVFSVPTGAQVTVNGKAVGTTPATLREQPSEVALAVEVY